MALSLNILSYTADDTSESGTTTTNIKMTGHGLETGDYIVNTTRATTADRASRKVTKVDVDNVTVAAITGQTTGDTIKKYNFTDRSGLLRAGSLSVNMEADNAGTARFELITTTSYIPRTGQEVIIKDGSSIIFGGILNSARRMPTDQRVQGIFVDCQCDGYNAIPGRRTVQPNHEDSTAGEIVSYWIDNALNQEGITEGTVNSGCTYDNYKSSVMSVKDILDKCAADSGFKWFIDKSKTLQFYQDDSSITDSTYNLTDASGFVDFWDFSYTEKLDEYLNKVFVVGGRDDYGYIIFINQEDETESTARQAVEAGSGVYGYVYEDSSLDTATYNTAESGTTTTNITITGHGLSVGDYIYNFTRTAGRNVTAVVDADNVTVDAVTSQTNGDEIIIFEDANQVITNLLKKRGIMPVEVTFRSTTAFIAGERLNINLSDMGISSSYYYIERVEYYDANGKDLHCYVRAIARKSASFSTQISDDYRNYFAKIIEKGKGTQPTVTDEDNQRYGVDHYVQDDEPTRARGKDTWIPISDLSNVDIQLLDATDGIDLTLGKVIYCSGASVTLTLPAITATFANTSTNIEDAGIQLIFKNIDASNTVTIDTTGSDTIDGGASYSLTAGSGIIVLAHRDETDWRVI